MTPHYEPGMWIAKRWQKDTRYYVAEINQDLFGNWLLRRTWGRLSTHMGHSKTECAEDYAHALQLLKVTTQRRTARGYRRTYK